MIKLLLNKNIFYLSCILFCIIPVLYIRYINLGYPKESVQLSVFFYFLAICLVFISGIRYKSIINPLLVYSLFVFFFSYSIIPISNDQKLYSLNTYIVVFISILFYVLPFFLNLKFQDFSCFKLTNNARTSLLLILLFCSVVVYGLECLKFGYIPILNFTQQDVYNDSNTKLIPFLHYFIIITAYLPSWAYIFYKENIISKKKMRWIFYISLFVLFNYLSRQIFLLLGLSLFISYNYYNKVNVLRLFQVAFCTVGLFFIFGYIRFSSDVTDSFAEFMRIVADIDNPNILVFESTLVEYSSKRYTALDHVIHNRDEINFYGLGMYTFRPLLSLLFLEKFGVIERIPELDSEILIATYAADPYLDFGFLGVIFLNFLYGCIAVDAYKNYQERKVGYCIVLSIVFFVVLWVYL